MEVNAFGKMERNYYYRCSNALTFLKKLNSNNYCL